MRQNGDIAQLARACGSYPQCPRFESRCRYHRPTERSRSVGTHFGEGIGYGPLVKWLRHGPFTAVTWVRIPYGSPSHKTLWHRGVLWVLKITYPYGGLAQLVRAPASHAGGHWFESSSLHQKVPDFARNQELFLLLCSKYSLEFFHFSHDPNRDP